MTLRCGDCGGGLRCEKNGALMFSVDLDMLRRTDAYLCPKCDQMILTGHGDNWNKTSIEMISLKERYNVAINYEHYSAVENRPVCADCSKTMDFMGDGIFLLKDEHSYVEGKMWVCSHCDYIFIDYPYSNWPPPLTLDEKRELEKKYAPNMIREGTGVIPFFDSIKKAEDEEGNTMVDFLIRQAEEGLEKHELEQIEKEIQVNLGE